MSRHDYDRAAALVIYIELEPPHRTFAEVARRVGCHPATVAKWAREERWEEQLEAAQRRGVRKALKTREERTAQVLRIYERAAELVDDALDPDDPKLTLEQVFAKFPDIHRIYRLETEQATDHVALADVQAGFRTAMGVSIATHESVVDEVLAHYVKPQPLRDELAAALKKAFRTRFFPAVNEALAIGGGE